MPKPQANVDAPDVQEALSQGYLNFFITAFYMTDAYMLNENYGMLIRELDNMWSKMPSWVRKEVGTKPSEEIKSRVGDRYRYSYVSLGMGKETDLFSKDYTMSQQSQFVDARKAKIISIYYDEFCSRVIDTFQEFGLLLTESSQLGGKDIPTTNEWQQILDQRAKARKHK